MTALATGLDFVDLDFLDKPGIIATGILHGSPGVALVDPGPSTTLPTLRKKLVGKGMALADVRAILLTHIHLDHAGATGTMLDECPGATVYVHARGAPHLSDPTGLLASASRLYGADMQRLWGEVRAVPAGRIHVLNERDRLEIVGHEVESVYTPGHASHHVSYFLPSARLAFVGDTGGIARGSGRLVIPPTPPPDIDLEAWRASTDHILAWNPDLLFLTHFGPHPAPRVHMQDLWTRLEQWSRRVRALLETPGTDAERAETFTREVTDDIARATSRAEAQAYSDAGRFDFSWTGLARYWRKQK
ncbi:MAG TPA: MBL fold metallo-hydrolase [Vicinamibacterales bacterium]|nr:MBL fold metallo-hydrolase [Vicinamibacterales bacterium]